jgi:hypothetical protein
MVQVAKKSRAGVIKAAPGGAFQIKNPITAIAALQAGRKFEDIEQRLCCRQGAEMAWQYAAAGAEVSTRGIEQLNAELVLFAKWCDYPTRKFS